MDCYVLRLAHTGANAYKYARFLEKSPSEFARELMKARAFDDYYRRQHEKVEARRTAESETLDFYAERATESYDLTWSPMNTLHMKWMREFGGMATLEMVHVAFANLAATPSERRDQAKALALKSIRRIKRQDRAFYSYTLPGATNLFFAFFEEEISNLEERMDSFQVECPKPEEEGEKKKTKKRKHK
jgi:hypothetical protein